MNQADRLTHIDLFAGVGGITLGFEATGIYDTRLLVDSDLAAAQTFKRNRPRAKFWPHDLRAVSGADLLGHAELEVGELDVLTAGPPCQGLSKVGTRQLEDERNQLLAHTAELIVEIQPKIALIENVPALFWDEQSTLFDEVANVLHEAHYVPNCRVLEAWRFGVPQLRRRLFIVAVRGDLHINGDVFPAGRDHQAFTAQELIRAAEEGEPICPEGLSVEEAIGDLPQIAAGGGAEAGPYGNEPQSDYQRERRRKAQVLFNHKARSHSTGMLAKVRLIPEGGRNQDLPDEHRLRNDDREYFSQAYARLHRHGIAQTITTSFHNPGSGRFIHHRDDRALTVREGARFQSFDDDFMFVGKAEQQLRQVGNAVPVLLAKALGQRFATLLGADGVETAEPQAQAA